MRSSSDSQKSVSWEEVHMADQLPVPRYGLDAPLSKAELEKQRFLTFISLFMMATSVIPFPAWAIFSHNSDLTIPRPLFFNYQRQDSDGGDEPTTSRREGGRRRSNESETGPSTGIFGFERIESPKFEFKVIWLRQSPSFYLHLIERDPSTKLPEGPWSSNAAVADPHNLHR
ncbi:hypothetical protein Ccrd_024942, partial [Cynara cardunculus var. scolymus]